MPPEGFLEGDLTLGHRFGNDLRMVINLEFTAEVRIILFQGIVAVRTGRNVFLTL